MFSVWRFAVARLKCSNSASWAIPASSNIQMQYFLYRLIPPRPTFPQDMTETESQIMARHVGYWSQLLAKGIVVAFGPVADPKGSYGIAILEATDAAAAESLVAADPAIAARAGFRSEVLPMPRAIARAASPTK
jgi:uncharacterized protein